MGSIDRDALTIHEALKEFQAACVRVGVSKHLIKELEQNQLGFYDIICRLHHEEPT
ncbi:MAG: hypothetical protein Q7T86_03330 [Hyphomicrobiaceae bacterium]|nr:hypothetical protein [Hyphomicrobiaceae bacterium]